jgi:RNA polymerase sigma factor (sigma-70 family)
VDDDRGEPPLTEPMTNETARAMRAVWFRFLDEVEPIRPKLHAYCLKLTGSVFDAEDLAQETLLRAFAVIGQGDLSAGASPISNARAWLCRIATNLWIDGQRAAGRRMTAAVSTDQLAPVAEPAVVTAAAAARLFDLTAPQERAAVVLKDVFDFSLDEIATILATTVGAVKSALHRARGKLAAASPAPRSLNGAPAELVDRFVAAFNARDLPTLTSLLLGDVVFEARGVGGERGRDAIWLKCRASGRGLLGATLRRGLRSGAGLLRTPGQTAADQRLAFRGGGRADLPSRELFLLPRYGEGGRGDARRRGAHCRLSPGRGNPHPHDRRRQAALGGALTSASGSGG